MGIFDHPPDPDVPGLKGRTVGENFATKTAAKLTKGFDFALDTLDKLNPLD